MKTSEQGFDLIKRSEGLVLHVYTDAVGFPTIGYGHKVRRWENFPGSITEEGAEALLAADVAVAEVMVNRNVTVPLTQGQFDALVDFVFNLGGGAFFNSTLLRELNAGQYDSAGQQLLLWDHGKVNGQEEVLAGLKARREAEFNLWRGQGA